MARQDRTVARQDRKQNRMAESRTEQNRRVIRVMHRNRNSLLSPDGGVVPDRQPDT